MKTFQLTVVLLLVSFFTYSQEFSPGKVVRSKGDTLYGFIQDTGIIRMMEECHFKENKNSKDMLSYKPFEIQSYEVNDKVYTSKIFTNENGKQTNAFVLKLIGGRVSMYQYKELFLVEKNNQLQVLSRKDTLIYLGISPTGSNLLNPKDKSAYVKERHYTRHIFLYQLDSIFVDCLSRHSFLNAKMRFTVESFSSAVTEYNKCVEELDFVYKKPKAQKRFYIKGFGGPSSFTYPSSFSQQSTNKGSVWGIGLNYQIAGDKLINKRFINQFEVDIANYSFSDTDYKSTILAFGFIIQYALMNPNGNGYPYLEAGVKGNMYLNENNYSGGFPVGLGWQTGWNNKSKMQFGVRYFPFNDVPFYRIKNVMVSIGIAF